MLEDAEIARPIARWRIARNATVLTVGDSITTYRFSYAELLRALLALVRPADEINLLNVGQSGYTSTHAREVTFTQFLPQQPDWVFVMYGVNDCKQFGGTTARTLVSLREYAENMRAVVEAFTQQKAHVVLLTPTPVVESITNALPAFRAVQMTWDNRNIAACAEAIRAIARDFDVPCVDLLNAFGMNPDPALLLPDGLHPNFVGQRLILRQVVRAL
jgi:lysophospholipase L1-like esterase